MSKETTYTCDRCKKSSIHPSDLHLEQVQIVSYWAKPSYSPLHRADWCLGCRNEVGIIALPQKEGEAPITPATLEELVREIIREEIDNAK
jgi:hypothetical protein